MKKYVGYIFAFVGYSIIILNLLVILNPALFSFLYFIYAMIVGFFWLKIAEWLGVRIVLFEKIIEYSDKNESFNKIKTYLKLDEQSENNKPDKNETGEFIDGAKKEIKTFANKTSNTVKTYSENFNEWRKQKTQDVQNYSINTKMPEMDINSDYFYRLRLWLFLIITPLITWIFLWNIVSWPFVIWFSFWFESNDALNLSRVFSLLLAYYIIIRIYSHCTNHRNLPITSELFSDYDPYVVKHLFRMPTDLSSWKLTGRAILFDFIGGYLLLIFSGFYILLSYSDYTGIDFDNFISSGYPSLIITLLAIAIMVPIMEELMFRGFVLDLASEEYGKWTAIFISAFLFAIIHPLYPVTLLNAFWGGLVYGYLRIKTNSLWPPIMLHSFWNAHLIILEFFDYFRL
tara:strand:+ start:667 stop:1869 length:1203 start_codon:yes stop_codon:yes gene_type:complete